MSIEYQNARLKQWKADHPNDPGQGVGTHPSARARGKLHPGEETHRYLKPIRPEETLAHTQEGSGSKITAR